MQFKSISNWKTVVQLTDGSVRKIRHNPPLSNSTILEFLAMLLAPVRSPRPEAPPADNLPPVDGTPCPPPADNGCQPHDRGLVVGYYMVGRVCHPLTVLSGASILQVVTGKGGQHLGQFTIELYQEAARVLGYGLTGQPVQSEDELMRTFARTVRDMLPGFRQVFLDRHPGVTIDGDYSRRLFGTAGGSNGGSQSGSTGSAGIGDAPGTGTNGEGSRRTLPYNRVMAQTIRGVLGLAHAELSRQAERNPGALNFASIARLACDIRRTVTGNRRGGDILPRTALRILGRSMRLELQPAAVPEMSDDRLFGMFTHLTVRDEQPITGTTV